MHVLLCEYACVSVSMCVRMNVVMGVSVFF